MIGYNILSKVSGFHDIALCVRHHHERWDGSGYPDGLSGMAIPLGARIISLADSVDAMMSVRKYRQKLTAAYCRNEIARCCGSMYDPQIAAVLLAHWTEIAPLLGQEDEPPKNNTFRMTPNRAYNIIFFANANDLRLHLFISFNSFLNFSDDSGNAPQAAFIGVSRTSGTKAWRGYYGND